MVKNKSFAFTLSEMLITLSIVGVLAMLVLPGLIKDSVNKAQIALLQSTVTNISDAVQTEIVSKNATNIFDTSFGAQNVNDPLPFVRKHFDITEECEATYDTPCTGAKYTNLNGASALLFLNKPVLLTNGVSLDFYYDYSKTEKDIAVRIDLNGKKSPNIIGVDTFYLYIVGSNDLDNGRQVGDVKGLIQPNVSLTEEATNAQLQTACKDGSPSVCYLLLERTGFEPNYSIMNFNEEVEL